MIKFNASLSSGFANALATAINAGGAAATASYYDGTRPAQEGGTATTLVVQHAMAYPAESGISGSTITFSPSSNGIVVSAGPITWCRIKDSTGAFVMDLDVSDFSALYNQYSVSSFNQLAAHFSVQTPAALLAALNAADRAKLSDIVLSSVSFDLGTYVSIDSWQLTM